MKLTHNCPKCNKPIKSIQSELPLGNLIGYVYNCGHLEVRTRFITQESNVAVAEAPPEKVPEPTFKELYHDLDEWVNEGGRTKGINEQETKPYVHPSYYSVDGKEHCYPYQIEGINFAEKAELNCLIGDAVGAGKTVQGLKAIFRNRDVAEPCAWIVKGSLIFQWGAEFHRFYSNKLEDAVLVTSRNHLIKGFKNYIFSMDMLAKKDFVDILLTLGLKSVVIDEVQCFKDSSAKRTQGLIRLIKDGNIKFKIALSGTAIKNRADEYFTILNILAPLHFPSMADFRNRWLVPLYDKMGKQKGFKLNPYRLEAFKELTGKWIIRREKHEVLKDLPDLTRDYQIIEITDPNIRNSYNHTVDLFKNWMDSQVDGIDSHAMLGWLAQLRALTGQAKCKNAIDWINDFLESTDESIAVGIQHHSVRDTLYIIFDQLGINPLKLSGEDNVYRKNDIVRAFTSGSNRLLIINSLAGGVGLNLQTCANALVLERQWNSADEEQFEARFHRNGQKKAVTVTYMIAKGTIDEFFHDMVLRKRKILHEAGIGTGVDLNSDIDSLKDLANLVVNHKI